MTKVIVTAGQKYNDIDALACSIAYNNLLRLRGIDSGVILTGALNESVSISVKKLNFSYDTTLKGNPEDFNYALVDISDHTNISYFVPLDKITEVYDHRWGFEAYWKSRPDVKVVIDTVGSCATLIWEKFKEFNLQSKIDKVSANLLYTAIVSNTLNLKAQITNERDLLAVEELKSYVDLPNNWIKIYFDEITASVLADPIEAIKNDTKVGPIKGVDFYIMQIELWNSQEFITLHKDLIIKLLESATCDNALLTSPSISEGKNYIYTLNENVKKLLAKTINAKFAGNLGTTDKLWLRKEIIRELSK